MNYEQQRVKDLRNEGLTYQQIGDLLGFSRQRAHQILSGYESMNVRKGFRKVVNLIIKKRDGECCQFCMAQDNLILHHKDGDTRNNNSYNLITMCQRCHRVLHSGLDK